MLASLSKVPVTDRLRALSGFALGLLVMFCAVRVFVVNSFDFENMQHGVRLIVQGINPWAPATRIPHFYNPPYAVLFLWPMLFLTPKFYIVVGGALLFAFIFYRRAWVALAWFATNTALWLVAAGGIDMFVMGAGLLLLAAGDRAQNRWAGLLWRVMAYGLLMIKPQGGCFIVALYILMRRDWKGLLASVVIYGWPFISLYPDWIRVLLSDPPRSQVVASHTIWAKYGPAFAGLIALGVLVSRKWKYWQLGGALAGIMTPYGMPGVPILLILSGVRKLAAIPIFVLYSGCLAVLTWVTPPAGVDFYEYISPLMAIYHLSMLGLALVLACLSGDESEDADTIALGDRVKQYLWSLARSISRWPGKTGA
jgi:hypothetical protein